MMKYIGICFSLFSLHTVLCMEEDIWVAVEDKVEMFHGMTKTREINVNSAKHVIAMSDPVIVNNQITIYMAELGTKGPSVFKIEGETQTQLAKDLASTATYFEDIAYDPVFSQLFLTSKDKQTIFRMNIGEGINIIKTNLTRKNQSPTGIALDHCTRTVYWTNSHRSSPSLEMFSVDNPTMSTTLVMGNMTRPRAVAVDMTTGMVYWSDTYRGTYTISRVGSDGNGREVVCSGGGHEVFSMVVTDSAIYWSDWAGQGLWRLPKDRLGSDCSPEMVKRFPTSRPHGVTWIPEADGEKCVRNRTQTKQTSTTYSSTEVEIDVTSESNVDKNSHCWKFCLSGTCHLSSSQEPFCECPDNMSGDRCETDKCHNYCLNPDSSCVVLEGTPECVCIPGVTGDRCQETIHQTDQQSSSNNSQLLHSSMQISPDDEMLNQISFFRPSTLTSILMLSGLSLLTLLVLVLSVVVYRMRKRPKMVRKRFISIPNKMDNEQKSSCSGDGVTLDIENCCNMTLCDTPCFDPPTRGPKKTRKISGRSNGRSQTEDKSSLLDNEDDISYPDF